MRNSCFLFGAYFGLLLLGSCADDSRKEDPIVAQVGESTLRESELKEKFTNEFDYSDVAVKVFVNNWVRDQVVLKEAAVALSPEEQNFEAELAAYRNSLLRYNFELKVVEQSFDTVVSQQEIEEYYRSNSKNFELKENVVKCRLLFLSKDFNGIYDRKKFFNYEDSVGKAAFVDWVQEHQLQAFVFDTSYVKWDQIRRILPVNPSNVENFISKSHTREYWEEDGLWLVKIDDYQLKDNISPLEMVEDKIATILVNQRKLSAVKEKEKELYQKALEKGEIKVFLKD